MLRAALPGETEPRLPKEAWALDGDWKLVKGAWVLDGNFWKHLLESKIQLTALSQSVSEGSEIVLVPHVHFAGLLLRAHWEVKPPGGSWQYDGTVVDPSQSRSVLARSPGVWHWRLSGEYTEGGLTEDSNEISVQVSAMTLTATGPGSVTAPDHASYAAVVSDPSAVSHYEWWYASPGAAWLRWTPITATMVWPSNTAGAWQWMAKAVLHSGRVLESNVVHTSVAVQRSTVSVSGPGWALSEDSGEGGPMRHIVRPTFTAVLSNPSAVSKVEWSVHFPTTGWQATMQTDWNPTGNVSMVMVPITSRGDWHVRVLITHKDGAVAESNHHHFQVLKKTLSIGIAAGSTSPTVGSSVVFTASCGGECPSWQSGGGYYYTTNGSPWNPHPAEWHNVQGNEHWWTYREDFPDGSHISAPHVSVSPHTPAPVQTEYRVNGAGHNHNDLTWHLRNAINTGWGIVHVGGNWNISGTVWIPHGMNVIAHGATFTWVGAGRFRNADRSGHGKNDAGGYDAGTFSWVGGTFNADGTGGIFTLSHSPGFVIRDAVFQNYCSNGHPVRGTKEGHAIEINSSGGPDLKLSAYTISVTGNQFQGSAYGQRPNSNDEPVHYDWAWSGSGNSGADDHTMTHNVHIASNTFWSPWDHPKCAIGGHRMSSASYGGKNPSNGEPSERHNSFLIENNQIHGASGGTSGVSPNKGAIALWNVRGAHVRNNTFHGCGANPLISGWDANSSYKLNSSISVYGNNAGNTMPASNTTGG